MRDGYYKQNRGSPGIGMIERLFTISMILSSVQVLPPDKLEMYSGNHAGLQYPRALTVLLGRIEHASILIIVSLLH